MTTEPPPSRDAGPSSLRHALPIALATGALALLTVRTVLERAGGPSVPLDDTYIHFQYARSVAELHPFEYTHGAAPTPGATSLLWPLVLAPFHALGLRRELLVWPAWGLGFLALGLLAEETRKLTTALVRPLVASLAAAMVLAFGGFTWFAASGMEVVPLAWLLTRTVRRTAEWLELEDAAALPSTARGSPQASAVAVTPAPSIAELLVLAAFCPLLRPEGVFGSVIVAVALLVHRPRHRAGRAAALPALAAPLLPSVIALVATGQAALSTAIAKWLPLNPYWGSERLVPAVLSNVGLLFGTLLDGRLWTSVFLPSGGREVAVLALVALVGVGVVKRKVPRALLVLGLALCMLGPATYETFLVNRVRYIWPFAAAWLVGLATLCEACGLVLDRTGARILRVPEVLACLVVGLLGSRLWPSMVDVAESSEAITSQQVSLGKWAHEALPRDARVGVNDTGAIAYFSDRTTFDVVGLTTRGEARHWAAGAGSRFEHYEKLPRAALPTHFVVYPEWFALDALLGERLAERSVHHSILGGYTMAAHLASYDLLGTGARPDDPALTQRKVLDELDVADLESEALHGYRLLGAYAAENRLTVFDGRADGGRAARSRDELTLRIAPGGLLVMRCGAESYGQVQISLGDVALPAADVSPSTWTELRLPVPPSVRNGNVDVTVDGLGTTFESLHYWSYE